MKKTTTTPNAVRILLTAITATTVLTASLSAQTTALLGQPALPAELSNSGLTNVQSRNHVGPEGDAKTKFYANTPDGGTLHADVRDGRLVKVKTFDKNVPQAIVARMLPPAILSNPQVKGLTLLTDINLEDPRTGYIKVKGFDAQGQRLHLFFSPTGTLIESEIHETPGLRGRGPLGSGPGRGPGRPFGR